jgi:hypothetical protein
MPILAKEDNNTKSMVMSEAKTDLEPVHTTRKCQVLGIIIGFLSNGYLENPENVPAQGTLFIQLPRRNNKLTRVVIGHSYMPHTNSWEMDNIFGPPFANNHMIIPNTIHIDGNQDQSYFF